jgi:hypothetical protein
MLLRVALVTTDASEERSASLIRVTRILELGTTLAVIATDARCEELIAVTSGDAGATFLRNVVLTKPHSVTYQKKAVVTVISVF